MGINAYVNEESVGFVTLEDPSTGEWFAYLSPLEAEDFAAVLIERARYARVSPSTHSPAVTASLSNRYGASVSVDGGHVVHYRHHLSYTGDATHLTREGRPMVVAMRAVADGGYFVMLEDSLFATGHTRADEPRDHAPMHPAPALVHDGLPADECGECGDRH